MWVCSLLKSEGIRNIYSCKLMDPSQDNEDVSLFLMCVCKKLLQKNVELLHYYMNILCKFWIQMMFLFLQNKIENSDEIWRPRIVMFISVHCWLFYFNHKSLWLVDTNQHISITKKRMCCKFEFEKRLLTWSVVIIALKVD